MTRRQLASKLAATVGTLGASALTDPRSGGDYPVRLGRYYLNWRGWYEPPTQLIAVGMWTAIDPDRDGIYVSVAGGTVMRVREYEAIDLALQPPYRARLRRLLVDPDERERWRRDAFDALARRLDREAIRAS